MPDDKPKPPPPSPIELEKLLELELLQKRTAWQQAKGRRATLRIFSFLFLFLIIAGALIAYFVYFSPAQVNEMRARAEQISPTPAAEIRK